MEKGEVTAVHKKKVFSFGDQFRALFIKSFIFQVPLLSKKEEEEEEEEKEED